MYDIVGDIHGHAEALVQLLEMMGYQNRLGAYRRPDRKVIFLGDFVDRGPEIARVLRIVRSMVEAGTALSVIGNHEINALAYHTEDPEALGQYLRRHTTPNNHQISQTLLQLSPGDLRSHLDWFRTLPVCLDLEGLRVVHACWDDRAIARITTELNRHQGLTDELLPLCCRPGKELFKPIEIILKGKEASLPEGIEVIDKDGHARKQTRVRWYLPPHGQTYRTYTLTDRIDSDASIEPSLIDDPAPYPRDGKPVFVGHYWMVAERPEILAENVACVDYSVARGGFLCAYRWNGEQKLNNGQFIWRKNS